MSPGDEYASGGGKLRLKGTKVKDGRVDKKAKKKKKQKDDKPSEERDGSMEKTSEQIGSEDRGTEDDEGGNGREDGRMVGKTETERRYAEIRKKRVCAIAASRVGFILCPPFVHFRFFFFYANHQ